MAKNTKSGSLRTRDRILDAAVEVFYQCGVAKASLNQIAAYAGVTRGAVYVHFQNKIDLFEILCEQAILPPESLNEPFSEEPSVDALKERWLLFLSVTSVSPRRRKILSIIYHRCEWVPENAQILDRITSARHQARESIEAVLIKEVLRGNYRKTLNVRLGASLIHSSMAGFLDDWLIDSEGTGLVTEGREYLDMLLESFKCR